MNQNFYNFLITTQKLPKKILHLGNHKGQEVSFYARHQIETWHVEAIPLAYKKLAAKCRRHKSQHAVNAYLNNIKTAYSEFDEKEKTKLKLTTVNTLIEKKIIPSDIDFINFDLNHAEPLVLSGAEKLLESPLLIGCQISTAVLPHYGGGATSLNVSNILLNYGLYRKTCTYNSAGWTDTLFLRPSFQQGFDVIYYQSLETLRPKASPAPLIRVGGKKDGAYLLPDDLQDIKACFSPGVSNRKDFEDELLDHFGIFSHMCDYSSDPEKFETTLKPGQTFKKKWLGVDGSKDCISLEDWITEHAPDKKNDLILQMDIEGAEYRNLLATPKAFLLRFRIIVIELHQLQVFKSPNDFKKELGPLLERIDDHFICVHAHPNNCCGDFHLENSVLNMPNILELTFLRRDRWDKVAEDECYPPMLPHPLDITSNMAEYPPLFLNENWLDSGKRADASTIKLLEEQVEYLARNLNQVCASRQVPKLSARIKFYQLTQYLTKKIGTIASCFRYIK